MLPNDIYLDIRRPLPRRWDPVATDEGMVDLQPFASNLRDVRDHAVEQYGKAYEDGVITGRAFVALLKARAIDLMARQRHDVDGRAFSLGVQKLVNHLVIDIQELQ